MELINENARINKVWPYRTAYLQGAPLEVPWSKAIETSLLRLAPDLASEIQGKNHIVVGLDGGLYLWISDMKIYIGNQLVEESW